MRLVGVHFTLDKCSINDRLVLSYCTIQSLSQNIKVDNLNLILEQSNVIIPDIVFFMNVGLLRITFILDKVTDFNTVSVLNRNQVL